MRKFPNDYIDKGLDIAAIIVFAIMIILVIISSF